MKTFDAMNSDSGSSFLFVAKVSYLPAHLVKPFVTILHHAGDTFANLLYLKICQHNCYKLSTTHKHTPVDSAESHSRHCVSQFMLQREHVMCNNIKFIKLNVSINAFMGKGFVYNLLNFICQICLTEV